MRWNGVFLLGLGLTALGFATMAWTHVFGPAQPGAAAFSVGILACGALVACLGTLLNRRGASRTAARRRGARLFDGQSGQNGTKGRNFGQRQDYGALPPVGSKSTASTIAFKDPREPKPVPQKSADVLAIEGPR